jgi:predicted Zn-dependent protease
VVLLEGKFKMKRFFAGFFICFCVISRAATPSVDNVNCSTNSLCEFPVFLSPVFKPLLNEYGLSTVHIMSTGHVQTVKFSTPDGDLTLEVTHGVCAYPQKIPFFKNILGSVSKVVSTNTGCFVGISETEFEALFSSDAGASNQVFGFVLPAAVQVWEFSSATGRRIPFDRLLPLVNQYRYMEALQSGNVEMGHWGGQVYDYATWLLENGEKEKAVSVLKEHLKTVPFNYRAHVDFFLNAKDSVSASNSARVVYGNAEDQLLVEKAEDFLQEKKKTIADFPLLESGESGLQLILLPLPPCNPWLLEPAAQVFEEITGIPTKVCRLKSDWVWENPDRVSRQRDIQEMLSSTKQNPIDFNGWTKERYVTELKNIAEAGNALTKYYIGQWIKSVEKEPGQYLIDPYLLRLSDQLATIRSKDFRTMYVGVTEANIYSGDNRYLFSQGYTDGGSRISIFSYYMMQGVQNRSLLIERIGKELVPAALKQLGIERSVDPACPYSYANGVDRLDQKTRELSAPVKDALNRLR